MPEFHTRRTETRNALAFTLPTFFLTVSPAEAGGTLGRSNSDCVASHPGGLQNSVLFLQTASRRGVLGCRISPPCMNDRADFCSDSIVANREDKKNARYHVSHRPPPPSSKMHEFSATAAPVHTCLLVNTSLGVRVWPSGGEVISSVP